MAGGKVFAWDFVTPSRLVMLHTDVNPPDDQWDAYLERIAPLKPSTLGLLVLTMGGAPNVSQRGKLNDWIAKESYPRAIVTDSTVARGALTALSWFDKAIKAFPPEKIGDAFHYLGIKGNDELRFRATIKRLIAELDRPANWWVRIASPP